MLVGTQCVVTRAWQMYLGAWDYIKTHRSLHWLVTYVMGVCLLLLSEKHFNAGEVILTQLFFIDFKTAREIIGLLVQLLTAISFGAGIFVGITQGMLNFKTWKKKKAARRTRTTKKNTTLSIAL